MIFDIYPELENDFIVLKKPEINDKDDLMRMLCDKDVYRYEPTYLPEHLFCCGNFSENSISDDSLRENCRKFIINECDRLFNEKVCIILGIYTKENPDKFLGIAELYGYVQERNKISIGYRIRKEYWNRGIASSVVSLLKDYILNELKMERITAHVMVDNPASKRCLLKNGFVRRRDSHEEDWGFEKNVIADKYVIYPDGDNLI